MTWSKFQIEQWRLKNEFFEKIRNGQGTQVISDKFEAFQLPIEDDTDGNVVDGQCTQHIHFKCGCDTGEDFITSKFS